MSCVSLRMLGLASVFCQCRVPMGVSGSSLDGLGVGAPPAFFNDNLGVLVAHKGDRSELPGRRCQWSL